VRLASYDALWLCLIVTDRQVMAACLFVTERRIAIGVSIASPVASCITVHHGSGQKVIAPVVFV
jgi:hypothetical protein